MKLFAIFVMNNRDRNQESLIVASSRDLSSFGYFQRSSVNEFLVFTARTVSKRVGVGRSAVKEGEHMIYVQCSPEGYCVLAICDEHYVARVAFSMISSVCNDFEAGYRGKWEAAKKDDAIVWKELDATLTKFQKPEEADKILRLKKEIDETKVIMYQAIDDLLARGEKIDNLVAKSDDLGAASKTFYTQAKKTNSCCVIA